MHQERWRPRHRGVGARGRQRLLRTAKNQIIREALRMPEIRNVKLEFLRQGPAHNQLLSPLTPYLALCGANGGVTGNMPFEHRHLLNKLERLSYSVDGTPIAGSQRDAELRELGEAIGRVFGQVPALLSELGNARSELVHLRLSMAASELALVPFEL